MDRLRIAVIGLGWFGEIHCEAIVGIPQSRTRGALHAHARPPAGAGRRSSASRRPIADYREMLADPDIDAVSIVTMWDQHTEPAVAALEAGKHVFLEKPMASTVADCRQDHRRVEEGEGHPPDRPHLPLQSALPLAKQAIAAGRIGKIVSLSSRRNIPAAWTPTILNKIGPIVGDAIHDTDLMLWFTGDRVVSAYAQTVDVRGLKHPDIGQTMYRFAGGATATLETVWCMPEKTPYDIDERMNIIGTEGFIQIQDTFPNLGIAGKDKFHSPDTTYWPMFEGVRGGALQGGILLFRQLRAEGRQAGDRHARGCHGGAAGDARGGGIGAHGDRSSGSASQGRRAECEGEE